MGQRDAEGGGVADRLPTASDAGCRRVELGRDVDCHVGRASARTATVAGVFGIGLETRRVRLVDDVSVELGRGRIVALVGPSGCGKSSAIERIAGAFPLACDASHVLFPPGMAVVDGVAAGEPLTEAISLLTSCGMGDAQLWVRPAETLSEGERFRARLARAVSIVSRGTGSAPLLCDEFCSHLDRTTGQAVSFNLRKLVTRRRLCVVVACHDDDTLTDLQPDTIVRFSHRGRCEVVPRLVKPRRAVSFRRRLLVTRGGKKDYEAFAAMHYRATDELGFVDKVFVLRERAGGVLGIVVYAHGPLELALRNQATDGRYSRNAQRLNRDFRMLRRLVILPDVRGCGLGHYLVRKTLPLVGTKYVECLAAMGEFNPVFEKAGMRRVGQYDVSEKCKVALATLRELGVEPRAADFPTIVARCRRVREIVSRVVFDWYAATTGGGGRRVARQSPSLLAQLFRGLITNRPVYYLWQRKRWLRPTIRAGVSRRKRP